MTQFSNNRTEVLRIRTLVHRALFPVAQAPVDANPTTNMLPKASSILYLDEAIVDLNMARFSNILCTGAE
jgi:hypothetical protein